MRLRIIRLSPVFFAVCFFVAVTSLPAASQQPPAAATVFEGARLITGDGSAPIEDSAFVLENSRVTQVGRRGQITFQRVQCVSTSPARP